MNKILLYPVGTTAAVTYASGFLKERGISLVDHPTPEVTHLLLDIPSFDSDGKLRSGEEPQSVLERLPPHITVVGGNLQHPILDGYRKIDLLQDEKYLAENASITAHCALQVAAPVLTRTFSGLPVLIIGWGRIGKCLGQLLRGLGADVTVTARKEKDRAIAEALGYRSMDPQKTSDLPSDFRLIFNTSPHPAMNKDTLDRFSRCAKVDLASSPGLTGGDIVVARGLPGVYAPESSGKAIAEHFLRRFREGNI